MGAGPRHDAARAHRGPAEPGGHLPEADGRARRRRGRGRTGEPGQEGKARMSSQAASAGAPARRNTAALVWHQVRYEQLSFWRNPQSAFFSFAFPLVFFAILAG